MCPSRSRLNSIGSADAAHREHLPPSSIRRLHPSEIPQVVALLKSASKWASKRSFTWTAADIGARVMGSHAERNELFGCSRNGDLLGCFVLQSEDKVHWPEDRAGEALYLHKLAVKLSARGQGIGEALIDFACRAARRRRVEMLRLDTIPDTPLVAYYCRMGFRADPNGPADFGGRRLIRMERPVGSPSQGPGHA